MDNLVSSASVDMTPLYALIGAVIVGQLGTILTVIIWLLKATWKASQINSDVERVKKDLDSAHAKIRGLESSGKVD